jgi:hypothetical protein
LAPVGCKTPGDIEVVEGGGVAERVRVRDITNEEGNRLLRVVRRSAGSVVTRRRAQMVPLAAQGMDVPGIAKVTFTSPDRVREVLHNLQPGWVRRPVPALCRRPTAHLHPGPAAPDHPGRAVASGRP